jgi:hypothetical protein
MANPLDPYRNEPPALPMMTQNERLLAPKPAPQGDLRPIDSRVAQAGAWIQDNAGLTNYGRMLQNAGLGTNEGLTSSPP